MTERMFELERRIEELSTRLAQVLGRITAAEQATAKVWALTPQGGGGGGGQAFWCKSAHTSPFGGVGASGAWPTITPVTDTLAVYSDVGGTLTEVTASATVRWYFKDACGVDKLLAVFDNGDGSYDVVSESCSVNS